MRDYKWVYAIGELDYEFVENASSEKARALRQSEKRNTRFGIKRVAIIVIAALVTAFGLLMLNDKVRAAVLGVFITQTDNGSVKVHFDGEDTGSDSYAETDIFDVSVGYIPEGLTLFENENRSTEGIRSIFISTEDTIDDGFQPFIKLDIATSSAKEWGWSKSTYEWIYHTELNGMDAFVFERSWYQEETEVCMTAILFGDSDVTVNIVGMNLNHEEVWKVAENISW